MNTIVPTMPPRAVADLLVVRVCGEKEAKTLNGPHIVPRRKAVKPSLI